MNFYITLPKTNNKECAIRRTQHLETAKQVGLVSTGWWQVWYSCKNIRIYLPPQVFPAEIGVTPVRLQNMQVNQ